MAVVRRVSDASRHPPLSLRRTLHLASTSVTSWTAVPPSLCVPRFSQRASVLSSSSIFHGRISPSFSFPARTPKLRRGKCQHPGGGLTSRTHVAPTKRPASRLPTRPSMPRLSTIHPYPAMMPDDLVTSLVRKYGGSSLLDPFCGTGRVCLAAGEAGGTAVGIDVNPLAVLISRAKSHSVDTANLNDVIDDLFEIRRSGRLSNARTIDPCAGRNVKWFGQQAARELGQIVAAIDVNRRTLPTQLLLAAVLSATVREVSFARCDQWKLHRLRQPERLAVPQGAWTVFERRLRSVWREILTLHPLPGDCAFVLGTAHNASARRSECLSLWALRCHNNVASVW